MKENSFEFVTGAYVIRKRIPPGKMIKQDISRLFSKGNEYSERPLNTFMWEGAEYVIHATVRQGVIEFLDRAHNQRG